MHALRKVEYLDVNVEHSVRNNEKIKTLKTKNRNRSWRSRTGNVDSRCMSSRNIKYRAHFELAGLHEWRLLLSKDEVNEAGTLNLATQRRHFSASLSSTRLEAAQLRAARHRRSAARRQQPVRGRTPWPGGSPHGGR